MNSRDPLSSIEADLAKPPAGAIEDKKVLADALWRLRSTPIGQDKARRAQVLLTIASRYIEDQADPLSAVEPAALASMLGRDSGDKSLFRLTLAKQGQVLFATGNVGDALHVLSDALASSQRDSDLVSEATVWSVLGVTLLESALYFDARECLRRAIEIDASVRPLSLDYAQALAKIAVCHLQLNEVDDGLAAVGAAVDILDRPATSHEILCRVFIESTYARLLLEKGWLGDAAERARFAEKFASASTSPRASIASALVNGLVLVHSGKLDAGADLCLDALSRARAFPSVLKESLLLAAQSLTLSDRADMALALHRELSVFLRRTLHESIDHFSKLFAAEATPAPSSFLRTVDDRHVDILEQIALTAEMRDDPTGEHLYRVARLAALVWEELGDNSFHAADIETAVRLHDIGKAAISDQLLLKRQPLSAGERALIERHSVIGAEMLARSRHPLRDLAADIARFHHERADGNGYPEGLVGEAIPLPARVAAVCDAYDSMTHDRPYRRARPRREVLDEIRLQAGLQFDPAVTSALATVVTRFLEQGADLDAHLSSAAALSPIRSSAGRIFAAFARTPELDLPRRHDQPLQQQQMRLMRPSS